MIRSHINKHIFLFWALSLVPMFAIAHEKQTAYDPSQPVKIEADTLSYSHDLHTAHAKGNVIVKHLEQTITADTVIYDKVKDKIYAIGNVVMYRQDGSTYYADTVELERSNYRGKLVHFVGRLNKRAAKITAKHAQMLDKDKLQMQEMSFSTCPICKDNLIPYVPIWRIRATSVDVDRYNERMDYRNAKIEILGLPVFYTPYFSTPTPASSRKSGFLQPLLRWSKALGHSAKIPIYASITSNMDATVSPIFTEHQGIVHSAEFRHLTKHGPYQLGGSFTHPHRRTLDGVELSRSYLGHIEGKGDFQIAPHSYTGFTASRVHDKEKTYLKKYKLNRDDVLRSHLYYTSFGPNLDFSTDILSFQGLRPIDNLKTTPTALPLFRAHYQSHIPFISAKFNADFNFLNLERPQSANYQRASINGELQRVWALPYGQRLKLAGSIRADGYKLQYHALTSPLSSQAQLFLGAKQHNGTTGRIYPELATTWHWPLYAQAIVGSMVLEPTTSLYIAPRIRPSSIVPNEDSQYTELSTYNLWNSNHYLGLDRRESGSRINYGVRGHWQLNLPHLQAAHFSLGQHRRLDGHISAENSASLREHISGYVGRISLINGRGFTLVERITLDHKTISLLLNEVYASLDRKDWNMGINYVTIRSAMASPIGNPGGRRQELEARGGYRFYQDWWAHAKLRTRLGGGAKINGGRMVYDGVGFHYKGECIHIAMDAGREYTRLRDLSSSNTYSLTVHVPTNW